MKRKFFIYLFIFSIGLLFSSMSSAQDFPDVCQQSENILRNCTFDSGLDHWQPFLETGAAEIRVLQGGGECHAPLCPAAYIRTEDHFIGGILQQVPVEQGRNYYANIVWLVFDSLVNDESINQAVGGGIGRRIGIDPFGGTDPKSPNVVWSEDNWRNDCKICNVEHVTVTAQADTITVFLRIDDTWRLRAAERGFGVPPSKDQFWIDDIGLKPVGGEPIAVQEADPPTNTPTPAPPPDTPTPEPPAPTATPEPANEPAAEETPLPADTVEPVAEVAQVQEAEQTEEAEEAASPEPAVPEETPTPAATNTPVPPPPTLTPTSTPSPTATSRPRPTVTRRSGAVPPAASSSNTTGTLGVPLRAAGATACLGGIVLIIAAVIIFAFVWLYRVGWNNIKGEYEDEDDQLVFR